MKPSPPGQHAPPGHGARDEDSDDEREYAAFVQAQDPLDIEAATWVARQRNGLDAAGQAGLRAWLQADPGHQAAYDDMDGTFGRLHGMPDEHIGSLRQGLEPAAAPHAAHRPASPGRRAWMRQQAWLLPRAATAAAMTGLAGGAWLGWEHWRARPRFEKGYRTLRGQQLHAELPDGSRLWLDTATDADVRLYRDRREVHLREGQALFSVQADAGRPLHVFAGGLRITVVGTRFSVRSTRGGMAPGETRVVVEEGRVRVAALAADGAAVELAAGQSLQADARGRLGAVAQVPPASAAPWRDGRLSFDGTPLAQAVAEFERYGSTGLVVRDPAVAALRVGGSFQIHRLDSFVQSLPRQLPVRLQRQGAGVEVLPLP